MELLILAIFTGLAYLFVIATPLMEASDEAPHAGFTFHVKETGQLPNAKTGAIGWAQQETTQAPLYYVIGAHLIMNKCLTNQDAYYVRQPNSPIGRADLPGLRYMFRIPQGSDIKKDDTTNAIYTLRTYSIFLLFLSILLVRTLIKRVFPNRSGAASFGMAVIAFNPMVLFIGTSVCNDNLVIMLVTATLVITTFNCRRVAWILLLAITTALAILTKTSALILLPIFLVFIYYQAPSHKIAWRNILLFVVVILICCGWWFWRNWILYGEWLATQTHIRLAGNARPAQDYFALFKEWTGFVKSYWGVFGAFNIIYTDTEYYIFYGITVFILAGGLIYMLRPEGRNNPLVYIAMGLFIINLLAVALWTSRLWGSAGRLLFPSLGAIAIMAVAAWTTCPPRLRILIAFMLPGWLLIMSLRAALFLIPAAYYLN